MKNPGLDGRHRDKDRANMTLATMRKKTGEVSEAGVRRVAARKF